MAASADSSKPLRIAGISTLLAAAALVLSGCWGTYFNVSGVPGPQPYVVVLHEKNTAETIWACEANHPGDGLGRAKCALGVVRLACHEQMLQGWDMNRCLAATDYTRNDGCNRVPGGLENCAEAMRRAITAVLGDKECVAYEYHAYFGPSYGWFGVDHGFTGCP